ncbi:MAG: hypothetical protein K6A36_05265 [Paludibacteraceae bacterium]|nr:hypothetical protein [Paludibacteraceae bacterium]
MRLLFSLIFCLLAAWSVRADIHVSVSDPATWSVQELAPYVGQTIVFDRPMVVCTNAGSHLTVGPWRLFEASNQGVPGSPEYNNTVHINSECHFTLSGVSGYHRCGEKIYDLTVKVNSPTSMSWVSGTWHGNTRADMEAGVPDVGDYRLLVCAMNLENYFAVNFGSLGARSYAEHQQQRAKVSKALAKINADIYGLVELEKGDAAIEEVVNDLNSNLPDRNYKFFRENSGAEASQKSDFVYDANKVEPIGSPSEISTELPNRKKMLCFREKATGEKFIYSINHFKAMSGGGDTESRRVNEARAVVNFYNSYRANSNIRDRDVLFMGDLNSHAKTKPIFVFTDNNMIDLHRAFHADSSYSYMFAGRASYIDHAICNETLYRQITGMAAYHINSDEDDRYTYDKSDDESMFRCSDHDPILVGLRLDSTLSQALEPIVYGNNFSDTISLYNMYDLNNPDSKSYFAIYNITGMPICPLTEICYSDEMMQQKDKIYTLTGDNPNLPDEMKQYLPLPAGIYIFHLYYKGEVMHKKVIIK